MDNVRAKRSRGMPYTAPETPLDAAHTYRTQAGVNSRAHYMLAERHERRRRLLGVPATSLSALVAAFTFSETGGVSANLIGGLATVVGVLVAIQTFLDPGEAARQHREAGIAYGSLRRRFDLLLLGGDGPDMLDRLAALYPDLDGLAKVSPTIPDSVYRRARDEAEHFEAGTVGRGLDARGWRPRLPGRRAKPRRPDIEADASNELKAAGATSDQA